MAGVSNAAENKIVDFLTGAADLKRGAPTAFIGLVTASISDTDTLSTITEAAYTGYTRVMLAPNGLYFGSASSGTASNDVAITFPNCTASSSTVVGWFTTDAYAGSTTDEVQTVTIDATGGTFTLTYSGQTTGAIAYNASTSTVVAALEALSNIGSGEVVVTGGPGSSGGGTPYAVTFTGTLANTNLDAMTANAGSLTGGAATATIDTLVAGGATGTVYYYGTTTSTTISTTQTPPTFAVGALQLSAD